MCCNERSKSVTFADTFLTVPKLKCISWYHTFKISDFVSCGIIYNFRLKSASPTLTKNVVLQYPIDIEP